LVRTGPRRGGGYAVHAHIPLETATGARVAFLTRFGRGMFIGAGRGGLQCI